MEPTPLEKWEAISTQWESRLSALEWELAINY